MISTSSPAIAIPDEDTEKWLIQFWNDYSIYYYIENLAYLGGNVTNNYIISTQKKTHNKLFYVVKSFAKNKEVAKINKVQKKSIKCVQVNFHLSVDKNDIEGL